MSAFGKYSNLDDHCKILLSDLIKIKEHAPDVWNSLIVVVPPITYRPVLNKFGWCVLPGNVAEFNIHKLVLFHFILEQYGYITCSYAELEAHFIGEKNTHKNKIVWSGELMILVLVFDVLVFEKKIISPANSLYDIIREHFTLLDANTNRIKELSRGSLKSSLSNAKQNNNVQSIVKNICTLLFS